MHKLTVGLSFALATVIVGLELTENGYQLVPHSGIVLFEYILQNLNSLADLDYGVVRSIVVEFNTLSDLREGFQKIRR